jgi:hypothetical protein
MTDASAQAREADDLEDYDDLLATLDVLEEEGLKKDESGRFYDTEDERMRIKWIRSWIGDELPEGADIFWCNVFVAEHPHLFGSTPPLDSCLCRLFLRANRLHQFGVVVVVLDDRSNLCVVEIELVGGLLNGHVVLGDVATKLIHTDASPFEPRLAVQHIRRFHDMDCRAHVWRATPPQ